MQRCQLLLSSQTRIRMVQQSSLYTNNYASCYLALSSRGLSQLTNSKHHSISSNHYNAQRRLSPSLTYLALQKRSFAVFNARTLDLSIKALIVYIFLFLSYKYFASREERGPRLEILENHCYSPFHLNSILSLIYPKLLTVFRENSNIYIPSRFSKPSAENEKHDIQALITDTGNDYNIDIHQKVWIDQDSVKEKDRNKYQKFFEKSFLHSFHFELEHLSFDQINFEITDIVQQWFTNFLSHSFSMHNEQETDIEQWEQQQLKLQPASNDGTEPEQKSASNDKSTVASKPGLRLTLANTLRFDEQLEHQFTEIDASQMPWTEIAYFNQADKQHAFGDKYLKSEVQEYQYIKYQNHEIVVIPFKHNESVSLILSLPVLDYDFILQDRENKKYTREQKYIRWSIHPHFVHNIFDSATCNEMAQNENTEQSVQDTEAEQVASLDIVPVEEQDDSVLHKKRLQLFLPQIDREFDSELKDHHIVAAGLSTVWLPLYYGKLCLKTLSCKSYLNINADKVKFELLSVAYFDEEKRVWAAMRWKYGIREIALKLNWYTMKEKLKSRWKKKDEAVDEPQDCHTVVFDRPFDYYLYDSSNQIVYACGTVS